MRAELPRFQNLWELTVLCTLREAPMHPYEILRLLKERHKEEVLVLKRGSLYHAIERLLAAGHIEELDTRRNGRRPGADDVPPHRGRPTAPASTACADSSPCLATKRRSSWRP